MKEKYLIKRYSNRKLYDMQKSAYITLEDISSLVKSGVDVKVIENNSKKDITTSVLMQIVFFKKENDITLSTNALKGVIQSSSEVFSHFLQKKIAKPVLSIKDDALKKIDDSFFATSGKTVEFEERIKELEKSIENLEKEVKKLSKK